MTKRLIKNKTLCSKALHNYFNLMPNLFFYTFFSFIYQIDIDALREMLDHKASISINQ
jgi:hypothetical protein